MRAVGLTEFGDASVLKIVTLPVPDPGPGQVRVHVAAAAVNPTDTGFRAGFRGGRGLPEGLKPPYVPGMDLAGVIDALGPDVSGWAAGDRVMAAVSPWEPGGGAQAEYRVVGADQLARVPDGISLTAAATLPMNGMTTRTALDMLALPAGSVLAVTGAAGAVGGYAIQLGRHDGLQVVADAAPADEELVRGLGATHVVPRGDGFAAAVRSLYPSGADGLIDAALMGPPALAAIKDGGELIAVRPFQGETERGITISLVMVGEHLHEGTRVAELAGLAAKGTLTLRVAELIPAERAADAHRKLEAGGVRGRLVLTF
ncbi:MAG: NADP-dependent oxidoreductase [Actinobacteria bacterium]|nr:NADP-dependent oxidoreductase [Actinomycetota bacterium]